MATFFCVLLQFEFWSTSWSLLPWYSINILLKNLWRLQEESHTLFRRNQHLTDPAAISQKVNPPLELFESSPVLGQGVWHNSFSPWFHNFVSNHIATIGVFWCVTDIAWPNNQEFNSILLSV
jgi:hypothetical protein